METTAITLIGTPEQLAEGLKRFADLHAAPTPEPDFQDEKMTVAEAAQFMGIHYETMNKYIRQKKVKAYGATRTRFLLRSELIEDFKKMSNGRD